MHGFNNINKDTLQSKPSKWKKYDCNIWADFIELICLRDGVVSDSDILDMWYEGDVNNEYQRGEDKHLDNSIRLQGEIDDYFKLLKYREEHCKSFYPFEITSKNVLQIRENPPQETVVYLYLLFCSSISLMTKQDSDFFSNDFELFCSSAFGSLFPSGAKVELFGPRNKEGKYHGNLAKRIKLLGETIGLDSLVDNSPKYQSIPGGDSGLDILSYLKIDNAENIPFAFGQITCNYNDWIDKQKTVLKDNWNNKLKYIVQYPAFMLIPFAYHDSLDRFSEPEEITTFLIDRIRFIKLAQLDESMKEQIIIHCSDALE